MNILHICSDYSNQKVYPELVSSLDKLGVKQHIYVPTRTESEINKNIVQSKNSENTIYYTFSRVIKLYHKILYRNKIKAVFEDIENKIDVTKYDLIHAHFLFSDGGVAKMLSEKYNCPYIVAVRNTDINIFFKFFIHLRGIGNQILKNAQRIILITPSYKKKLLSQYIKERNINIIERKIVIIPNGLSQFWFDNRLDSSKSINSDRINVLYVGDFSKNKNITLTINAIAKLRSQGKNIMFTIVGGGGDNENNIVKLSTIYAEWVDVVPRLEDKKELLKYYRNAHVFVMPSIIETFGVAYLEALSQGLPIIYTSGQGVDGYFENEVVGYAVNPKIVDSLVIALNKIIENYSVTSSNAYQSIDMFKWSRISKLYYEIYKLVKINKVN